MRPRRQLPSQLPSVFSGAQAAAHGVTATRLRGADITHPFHGVNARENVSAVEAYRTRLLPGQYFSHHTAAALYGIPLSRPSDRLHVGVVVPRCPPRAAGVIGHRLSTDVVVMSLPDGTPICSPHDTWCQLAPYIPAPDLVATADFLLGARNRAALATADVLAETAARYAGKRGAKKRMFALSRARWGSDSRPETLL